MNYLLRMTNVQLVAQTFTSPIEVLSQVNRCLTHSPRYLTAPICFVCRCTSGITHLRGFEKFVSLKTLWLNGNKLQSTNGLDENVQLNSLHLHCNRIKRLDKNSFTQFKFLSRLTLNNNLLDDFDGTLLELKCMRNLLSLDLQNNPIAEEDSYRLRVLAMIPSLKIFDLHRYSLTSNLADVNDLILYLFLNALYST